MVCKRSGSQPSVYSEYIQWNRILWIWQRTEFCTLGSKQERICRVQAAWQWLGYRRHTSAWALLAIQRYCCGCVFCKQKQPHNQFPATSWDWPKKIWITLSNTESQHKLCSRLLFWHGSDGIVYTDSKRFGWLGSRHYLWIHGWRRLLAVRWWRVDSGSRWNSQCYSGISQL